MNVTSAYTPAAIATLRHAASSVGLQDDLTRWQHDLTLFISTIIIDAHNIPPLEDPPPASPPKFDDPNVRFDDPNVRFDA